MLGLARYVLVPLVVWVAACNNYNLRDQLENPGKFINERFNDRLFVFVTSQMTAGDMFALNAGSCSGTGIGKADCVCQAMAAQNGWRMSSSSRFIAWLSTSVDAAKCRMLGQNGTGCTPTGSFIWYNTNYQPVFTSFDNNNTGLLGSSLALPAAINHTEGGIAIPSGVSNNVWTGTNAGGTVTSGATCSDWQSFANSQAGRAGTAESLGNAWTQDSAVEPCDQFKRIYCIAVP